MPDGLYERDALAWAERHANLLRRLAAGERVNEEVDWPNVIEEVQDVGLSELRACKSLLRQALVHLLKLHAWPNSTAAAHWRSEVIGFRADMRDRFAPSMRQRIICDESYQVALEQVLAGTDDSREPRPMPETCPFVLDDLLLLTADVQTLVQKLEAAVR
jgi:hypothetical protein